MAMIVQHNITAMNASRMLGVTTGQQSKTSEKLASGYRINRAADDAAGLSISEKMRKQIRGLDRASTNAQDGVSAVQTAEGALTEVHSMLQRMNELAVQSANGTNSETDRKAIQAEIDQLVTEIDRVAETTKFNETYLLKGDGSTEHKRDVITEAMTAEYANEIEKSLENAGAGTTDAVVEALGLYKVGATDPIKTVDDLKAIFEVNDEGEIVLKEGEAIYTVAAGTDEWGAQTDDKIANLDAAKALFKVSSNALYTEGGTEVKEEDLKNYFNNDGTYKGNLFAYKTDGTGLAEVGAEQIEDFATVTAATTEEQTYSTTNALTFKLHVGSESADTNKISIEIAAMSASGIGVDALKGTGVTTQDAAASAIDVIAAAIEKVSEQRSALGALQNRLEHTIANLDNVVENTTAAESRIRDTDMAEEMVEYSKNNILAQAGQSMLAQANQSTQGVLSLLQ